MLGAFLHSSLIRLIPIGLLLYGFQSTMFVEMRPFGVVIQIMLAFAAAAGAVGGSERGVITGFVFGLIFDLSAGTPLGSSSITMGLAGYVAGWADLLRIETTWWVAAAFTTLGAAIGEAAVPVLRRFTGNNINVNVFVPQTPKIVVVVAVSAGILSIVFVPVARWALRLEKPEWKVLAAS